MFRKALAGVLLALIAPLLVTHTALSLPGLNLTVTTEKGNYHYRQLVNVYGNVTYNDQLVEAGLVALQIAFPRSLEEFNATRTIPANATPTDDWSIEITSIITTDSNGNPQSTFNKGGDAWFKTTIRNNDVFGDKPVLFTITLYDSDSTPFKTHWVRTTMHAGANVTEMVRLDLNAYDGGDWVSTGTAHAYANVYTNWPSMGGSPYSPEKTAAFTITSASTQITESSSSAAVPSPTASSYNSYHASIRLPPNIPLGGYMVTASAYYNGFTALAFSSFIREYEMPGDIIFNRKIDIFDVVKIANAYGTYGGLPKWDPEADLNANGKVDIFDIVTVAGNYLTEY